MDGRIDVSGDGTEEIDVYGTYYDETMVIRVTGLEVSVSWEQFEIVYQKMRRHFGMPEDEDEDPGRLIDSV